MYGQISHFDRDVQLTKRCSTNFELQIILNFFFLFENMPEIVSLHKAKGKESKRSMYFILIFHVTASKYLRKYLKIRKRFSVFSNSKTENNVYGRCDEKCNYTILRNATGALHWYWKRRWTAFDCRRNTIHITIFYVKCVINIMWFITTTLVIKSIQEKSYRESNVVLGRMHGSLLCMNT